MSIRYVEPLQRAVERATTICFRPFDLGKWFVLGFACWLARLAHSGGGGGSSGLQVPAGLGDREAWGAEAAGAVAALDPGLQEALGWAPMVLILGCVAVLLLVVLPLVLWVSSRGEFIFLDGVVHDRARIGVPWREYAAEGNSLFLWRLGFIVAAIVLVGLCLLPAGLYIWRIGGDEPPVAAMLLLILPVVLIAFAIAYVDLWLRSFVVPIMYHRRLRATEAWSAFLPILRSRFGHFVLYGLWILLLAIAIAFGVLVLVVVTCCIAGIVLIIPYLGTVLLLPVFVALRALSLEYLVQFDPDLRIFPPAPAAAAATP